MRITYGRGKVKSGDNGYLTFLLTVLLFSITTLYSEEVLYVYAGVVFLLILLLGKYIGSISRSICNKFFLWLTGWYLIVVINALTRTRTGEFNFDFIVFSYAEFILIIMILYNIKNRKEVIKVFCDACELSGIAVCVYILINEGASIFEGDIRLGDSIAGNVNTAGFHLGIYSLAIMFNYLRTRKKSHFILYIVMVIFLLLTGSKATLCTVFLGIILFVFYGKVTIKKIVIVSLVGIMFFYLVFANNYFYNLIGIRIIDFLGNIGFNLHSYRYSGSTQERLQLMSHAWKCFIDSPIIGGGFNTVAATSPWKVYAHNDYLEILANYGIIGFGYYLIIYYHIFSEIRKCKHCQDNRKELFFIVIVFINCILQGMFDVMYSAGVMPYIGVLISCIYFARNGNR